MHSITLTIDDTDPSGLWNVMKSPSRGSKNSASSSLQQRRRIGFRFFRSDSSSDESQNEEGLLEEEVTLPSSTTSSSSSLLANSYSSASTNTASTATATAAAAVVVAGNNKNLRQHGARSILHGIKRNLMSINMAISISTGGTSTTTTTGGATTISAGGGDGGGSGGGGGGGGMSFGGVINRHLKNRRLVVVDHRIVKEQQRQRQQQEKERQLDSSSVVFETVDYSTKTTTTMSSTNAAAAAATLDHEKDNDVGLITANLMEDITAAANDVGLNVNKAMRVITSAPPRGGDLSTATSSKTDVGVPTATIAAPADTSSQQEATFIIETPLFPIILPKAWEAPFMGTSSYSKSTATSGTSSTTTTAPSSSSSYISSMEITVAPPEDITTTSSSSSGTVKPTSHQLQQVTLPLIPKSQWTSFTGQEFFYPEPYNGLVDTGVCMASNTLSSEYVTWSGDKKTEKFIKDYMTANDDKSWYDALDSSQEVLVWSGKFISSNNNEEYYGSELPIIKTTSIIHKSPKYLAELLMDSTKVKAYNKMSLGRDDVHVFQSGVDTTREDGKLGVDGECKIVRNLTRPPMVNSNLEFVSEYYSVLSVFRRIYLVLVVLCVYKLTHLSFLLCLHPNLSSHSTYLILYSLHACTKVK
jgi:hypothetical protein